MYTTIAMNKVYSSEAATWFVAVMARSLKVGCCCDIAPEISRINAHARVCREPTSSHHFWAQEMDRYDRWLMDSAREYVRSIPDAAWNSLFVDYEKPHVERLWVPWAHPDSGARLRICLHKIHPCDLESEALFHPHNWPAVMEIVHGTYVMDVGHSDSDKPPTDVDARIECVPSSLYSMTAKDGWHRVAPIGGNVLSIMIMGPPWGRAWVSKPTTTPCRPLTPEERGSLLESFRFYGIISPTE